MHLPLVEMRGVFEEEDRDYLSYLVGSGAILQTVPGRKADLQDASW